MRSRNLRGSYNHRTIQTLAFDDSAYAPWSDPRHIDQIGFIFLFYELLLCKTNISIVAQIHNLQQSDQLKSLCVDVFCGLTLTARI